MECDEGSYAEKQEKKRRRVNELREEVAKQHGHDPIQGEELTDPKKTFVTMRNRRVQTERDMRETQNMMRKKRRELAAEKAAEPKPRCGDRASKRTDDTIRVGNPVEATHQEICSRLEGEELRIYMGNYHEFIMLQANAMVKAEEMDKEEDERRKREKERQKISDDEKEHRRKFTKTLDLIGFEVPHGSGSKMRGVIGQPKTNITAYFGLRKGSYTTATERRWRKFYHEHVKTSSYIITSWPDSSPHDYIAVGGSSSSSDEKKNMQCTKCLVGLIVDMKHGNLLCPKCGITSDGGEGVGMQASFAQQQATQKGAAPYERIAHFNEFLTRLEGSERTKVPQEVILAILKECNNHGIDPVKQHKMITYPRVRRFLRKLRFTKYFENIPQIIWRITYQRPITFSPEQRSELVRIFNEIQEPFEKFKGKRKNFLSYSYTIYKLCELMDYQEFMPMLQLLKAPRNRLKADKIWEQICKENGYEYIATDR